MYSPIEKNIIRITPFRKTPNCLDCGVKVSTKKTLRCIPCWAITKKGAGSYQYKGGKPKCLDCGKKTKQYTSKRCKECGVAYVSMLNKLNPRSPSQKCREAVSRMGKLRIGSKNPRWIHDRDNLAKKQERNDTAYRDWRRQVWLRDSFKCLMGNENCHGKIEAHHILGWKDHPELRYEINNGITLCHFHHPRKRDDEKRLSPYFQQILLTNKY